MSAAVAICRAPGPSPSGIDGRERAGIRLILLLGGLIALGPLSIDLYLPALPAIAQDLRASDADVQFTLTGMLLGLAVGQVLIGPLADAVGRRTPLIVGSVLHVVASLACAVAPNVALLDVDDVVLLRVAHAERTRRGAGRAQRGGRHRFRRARRDAVGRERAGQPCTRSNRGRWPGRCSPPR